MRFLGDVLGHGIGTAQDFEGIEAEAVRFIFDENRTDAQVAGHLREPGQRRFAVLRETLVECPGLGDFAEGHDRQIFII